MTLTAGASLNDLGHQDVMQLQVLLRQAGFDPGPIDGAMGPQTRAAYESFVGMNASGQDATTVVQLVADLGTNETPELWGGIKQGGAIYSAPVRSVVTPPAAGTNAGLDVSAGGKFTPEEIAEARRRYPHYAHLLEDPEIGQALETGTRKGWSSEELMGAIYQSNWWKTSASSIRDWFQLETTDPAQAAAELQQHKLKVENQFRSLGLSLTSADADVWALRMAKEGLSEEQVNKAIAEIARSSPVGAGSLTQKAALLKASAKSYLSNLTDRQALDYATNIFDGSMTDDGVASLLRTEAKGRFGWLTSEIDSGVLPADLFSGVKRNVAQMLEVDENTVDLSSPKWSALTSPVMDQGARRSMNLNEAQRWARNQSEWRFTQNANAEAEDMAMSIMKAMGVLK